MKPKRNKKGQFIKGQHYSRKTEFKKGNKPSSYKDGRTLNKKCIDCGIKIDYKATRCMSCLSKIKKGKFPKQALEGLKIWHQNHPRQQRIQEKDGYVIIYKPEHPYCDHEGYVKEHRLVYEEYFKCCLLPNTLIHHKNRNRSDNRIENLEAMTQAKHTSLHFTKDMSNRRCSKCNSSKTRGYWRNGKMTYGWYKYKNNGFLCKKCYELKNKIKHQGRLP